MINQEEYLWVYMDYALNGSNCGTFCNKISKHCHLFAAHMGQNEQIQKARKMTTEVELRCREDESEDWRSVGQRPLGLVNLQGCFAILIGGAVIGASLLITETLVGWRICDPAKSTRRESGSRSLHKQPISGDAFGRWVTDLTRSRRVRRSI